MASSFETCLIRYHVVGQRLVYSNFVLDQLAPKLDPAKIQTIFTNQKEAEAYGLQIYQDTLTTRICFDFNVVQLYSLLEVHDEIIPHLNTDPRKDLEKYLKDAWEQVEKQKDRICKWRNNFVAHGKSFAKDGSFITVPDLDPDYLQGQIDLFQASKCAVIYIHGFLINTTEYQPALATYVSQVDSMKKLYSTSYLKIDVDPILQQIKQKLKQNKLNDDIQSKLKFI